MGLRAASKIDVKAGDSGDDWSAGVDFDFPTWLVSTECWDANVDLQLSYDGANWQDAFEVDPDRPIVFPFQARSIRHKNASAGQTARYQLAGLV